MDSVRLSVILLLLVLLLPSSVSQGETGVPISEVVFGNSFIDVAEGPYRETIRVHFNLSAAPGAIYEVGLAFSHREQDITSLEENWFSCLAAGAPGSSSVVCEGENKFKAGSGASIFKGSTPTWMASDNRNAQWLCERIATSPPDGVFMPREVGISFSIVVTYSSATQPAVWVPFYRVVDGGHRIYDEPKRTTCGVLPLEVNSSVAVNTTSFERSIIVTCKTSKTSGEPLAVTVDVISCDGIVSGGVSFPFSREGGVSGTDVHFPFDSKINGSRIACSTRVNYPRLQEVSDHGVIDAQHAPVFNPRTRRFNGCRVGEECRAFHCEAMAYPTASYEWRWKDDDYIRGTSQVYYPESPTSDGNFTFICTASNLKGSASVEFFLIAYGTPEHDSLAHLSVAEIFGISVACIIVAIAILVAACYGCKRR